MDLDKELRMAYWDLATAWKLYDSALRDRRTEDVNYYAKQRQAAEFRARQLLKLKDRETPVARELTGNKEDDHR